MSIPISTGSGAASVAAEAISGLQYQQVVLMASNAANPASILSTGELLVRTTGSVITTSQNSSIIAIATGSVISIPSGSVLTIPTSSTITVWKDSSILAVPVGSVITVPTGSVATAITSIATANGGLHIWSPLGSRIQGTADLRTVQGASVAVIAAQGASSIIYVTNVQIANFGSSSVLVTIADQTTSILGYTIAPAGGGSNYDSFYKTAANNAITASINGTASVLVSMQGFKSAT